MVRGRHLPNRAQRQCPWWSGHSTKPGRLQKAFGQCWGTQCNSGTVLCKAGSWTLIILVSPNSGQSLILWFRTRDKLWSSSRSSVEPFLSLAGIRYLSFNPSISFNHKYTQMCTKLFHSCNQLLKGHLAVSSGIGSEQSVSSNKTRQKFWVRFGFTTEHPFSRWPCFSGF